MSTDEQDQIRGRALRELEEKETELRCCRLKAKTMQTGWNVLGQVLTGHMTGYTPTDELTAYPDIAKVQALWDDITRLTTDIAELTTLVQRPPKKKTW